MPETAWVGGAGVQGLKVAPAGRNFGLGRHRYASAISIQARRGFAVAIAGMWYLFDDAIHNLASFHAAHANTLDEATQARHRAIGDELVLRIVRTHPWTGKPRITAVFTIVRRRPGVLAQTVP